jgi:hypothetical protein
MKRVKRLAFAPYLDEREQQIDADYEWCSHDPEVRQRYGGKVVIAYRRKVWGVGRNHRQAWAVASKKAGCPAKHLVAFVVVPPLP